MKAGQTQLWVMQIALLLALLAFAAPSMEAQGADAALYKTKCAACHGPDGKGDTSIGKANKLRDLGSNDTQGQTDAALARIVADGKGKMPAYRKSLAPEQIESLITFIRTLAKK
ncbi:MAG TPA: cytochrome c [Candidatus Acidoferrum sp.]|jgi:mono/diheme cytochrome c family protein